MKCPYNKTFRSIKAASSRDSWIRGSRTWVNTWNILRKGKRERDLETHVFQYLVLGITRFVYPFAHFAAASLTIYIVSSGKRLTTCICLALLLSIHVLIVYRATGLSSILTQGKVLRQQYLQAHATQTNKLMMDISHVIKKIRNNVRKSGRQSRQNLRSSLMQANDRRVSSIKEADSLAHCGCARKVSQDGIIQITRIILRGL